MSDTHNTIMQIEQQSEAGDPDDPGSSGDADLPPEPPEYTDPHSASISERDETASLEITASESCVVEPAVLAWLHDMLRMALDRIERPIARISIRIMPDEEMIALHHRHCDIDETTDVLTFPAGDAEGPIEADIAVCIDVARRRATELPHDFEHEILLYALHGILHCLGFDDHDEDAYQLMHTEEDRLLMAIGLEAVFNPQRGAHRT